MPQRFSIVVAAPEGYTHSAAFQEVAESLLFGLRELGHEVAAGPADPSYRPIILAPHLLTGDPPPGSILYNMEQVDDESPWLTGTVLDRFHRFKLWDYSLQNAERLLALGIRADVVPIGYHESLTRLRLVEPTIDVLFYGSLNERRARILTDLGRAGVRVAHGFDCYGAERDAAIAQSRIVLNVHYYAAKVFEIVRCSYLLANRVCVVSEDPIEPGFESAVAWASYDRLVARCLDLLTHPAEAARQGMAGFAAMSARPIREFLRAVL